MTNENHADVAMAGLFDQGPDLSNIKDPLINRYLAARHTTHLETTLQSEPAIYQDLLVPAFPYLAEYHAGRDVFERLRVASNPGGRLVSFEDHWNFIEFLAPWIVPANGDAMKESILYFEELKLTGRPLSPETRKLAGGMFRLQTTRRETAENLSRRLANISQRDWTVPTLIGRQYALNFFCQGDPKLLSQALVAMCESQAEFLLPISGFPQPAQSPVKVMLSDWNLDCLATQSDAWI